MAARGPLLADRALFFDVVIRHKSQIPHLIFINEDYHLRPGDEIVQRARHSLALNVNGNRRRTFIPQKESRALTIYHEFVLSQKTCQRDLTIGVRH